MSAETEFVVPVHLSLAVRDALAVQAQAAGRKTHDFAAELIAERVLPGWEDRSEAAALQVELDERSAELERARALAVRLEQELAEAEVQRRLVEHYANHQARCTRVFFEGLKLVVEGADHG